MTDHELNKLLAEVAGKPWCKPTHGPCCTCQTCGWEHDDCQCDYLTDHNQMELVKAGLRDQHIEYTMEWDGHNHEVGVYEDSTTWEAKHHDELRAMALAIAKMKGGEDG